MLIVSSINVSADNKVQIIFAHSAIAALFLHYCTELHEIAVVQYKCCVTVSGVCEDADLEAILQVLTNFIGCHS